MSAATSFTGDEMASHISAGYAHPWTHPLHGAIPTAARMNDTWYVVLDGTNHYQAAPPQLATILSQTHDLLAAAEHAIARADA